MLCDKMTKVTKISFPFSGGGGGKVLEALLFAFSYAFSNASREASDVSINAFFPLFLDTSGEVSKASENVFFPRFFDTSEKRRMRRKMLFSLGFSTHRGREAEVFPSRCYLKYSV